MQRLAHSHRHVPYQTCSSAVRFSSVQTNPEPFKHSFMSVESFEDPQGTQGDREQTSFRHRGIPKASNLGNVSIQNVRAVVGVAYDKLLTTRVPTKDSKSNLDHPIGSSFASRLAKRQVEKASSVQLPGRNSIGKPPEVKAPIQRMLEGGKRDNEKEAMAQGAVHFLGNKASHSVRAPNQRHRKRQQSVNEQRPTGASVDLYQRDGQKVTTSHPSQHRNTTRNRPSAGRALQLDSEQKTKIQDQAFSSENRDDRRGIIHSPNLSISKKLDMTETDLHALFSENTRHNTHSVTLSTPKCISEKALTSLRTQAMLEEAGDYFRYLPAGLEETNRKLDPLKYASLTLARRRDVGLPARSRILEIITASVTRYRNKFA